MVLGGDFIRVTTVMRLEEIKPQRMLQVGKAVVEDIPTNMFQDELSQTLLVRISDINAARKVDRIDCCPNRFATPGTADDERVVERSQEITPSIAWR